MAVMSRKFMSGGLLSGGMMGGVGRKIKQWGDFFGFNLWMSV